MTTKLITIQIKPLNEEKIPQEWLRQYRKDKKNMNHKFQFKNKKK